MKDTLEILKTIIPLLVFSYFSYLIVRSFLQNKIAIIQSKLKQKNVQVALPIRLQAYERICLFLERMLPNNLIQRVEFGDFSSAEYQHILIHEIRKELNHNFSQQIYFSNEAWALVKNAVEELISDINTAQSTLNDEAKSKDLALNLVQHYGETDDKFLYQAIEYLKKEVNQLF